MSHQHYGQQYISAKLELGYFSHCAWERIPDAICIHNESYIKVYRLLRAALSVEIDHYSNYGLIGNGALQLLAGDSTVGRSVHVPHL